MSHYFEQDPTSNSCKKNVKVFINNAHFSFITDNDVFSKKGLDFGTRTLLETLDIEKIDGDILDFGCGSGRDSKYFISKGYKVKAIDGSKEMCKLASKLINQEVQCMKFDELDDINIYDGIWACSSILHVEKDKLPNILSKMIKSLKDNGVIYTSFKIGTGYEIKEDKYYNYLTKEEMIQLLNKLDDNVKLIDYFETLPSTKRNAKNTIWGNFIIKKLN